MIRTYNIGTDCYALLTSVSDPEFIIPVKITILERHIFDDRATYKVRVKEIYESNFELLKSHLFGFKVSCSLKSENKINWIKKPDVEKMKSMSDLVLAAYDRTFYLEDNYITLSKEGLHDLYNRFVKYLINYHYDRLYQIMSRSFLANTPMFENQKSMFKKRVEKIGFGDMFQKYELNLDI